MEYGISSISEFQDFVPGADGTTVADLSPNAVSALLFSLEATLDVDNKAPLLAWFQNIVTRCEVKVNGAPVIDLNGEELLAYAAITAGKRPIYMNMAEGDNNIVTLNFVVPFARDIFAGKEGLAAGKKGDKTLTLTYDDDQAALYDAIRINVAQIVLPTASPSHSIKVLRQDFTPTGTGLAKFAITREGELIDLMLWATTVPSTTASTATLDYIGIYENEKPLNVFDLRWESLKALFMLRVGGGMGFSQHTHELAAASYAQNMDTTDPSQNADDFENWAVLPFGSISDDYLKPIGGLESFELQANCGDTNAFKIMAVRRVPVAELISH